MPAKRMEDLSGQRFGRLVVLSLSETKGTSGHTQFLCRCDCGAEKIVVGSQLMRGDTRSCGCLWRESISQNGKRNRKHGRRNTRTYRIWIGLKQRCQNPKSKDFPRYGQRGITVSPEWSQSFEAFIRDMGEAPDGLSIDRVNNDLGYNVLNCRWATPAMQTANRRPTNKRPRSKSATN